MFSLMGNCVTWIKGKNERKSITLLAVGLDNAGKTTTVHWVKGENNADAAPTVGFSSLDLTSGKFDIKIFDLGGGARIRGIWHNYMAEAHGIVYVVDSSDIERMEECRVTFDNLISDSRLRGKPVLILANKQDKPNAMDELDLCNRLNLDEVVNRNESYSKVILCSALPMRGNKKSRKKPKLDRGIKTGFTWLLNMIGQDFETLQERITRDVEQQREREAEERTQRIERVKRIREERERQQNSEKGDGETASSDRPRPEGISHQELPNDATARATPVNDQRQEGPPNSGLGGMLLDDDTDDDVSASTNQNPAVQLPSLPGAIVTSTVFTENPSVNKSSTDKIETGAENSRTLSASSLREIVRDTPTPTQAQVTPLETLNEGHDFSPTLKPKAIAQIQDQIDETGSIDSPNTKRKKKKKKKRKKNRIDPGSDENMSESSFQTGSHLGRLGSIDNAPEISVKGLGKLPPIRNAPYFDSDVEL